MSREEIIQLFINNISPRHIMNDQVHTMRKYVITKTVHPFVTWMATCLEYIDNIIPGYAERIVVWISKLENKQEYEQNFAVFSEVLVLFNIASVADKIEGKQYLLDEPAEIKGSKNPEFRSFINGHFYAGEVKTPSLMNYINKRQEGIQITTHLPDRNLLKGEKVVTPNVLKILDNLISTNDKYLQYIKTKEYKDDYRFLFIVWDDFINEPISALLNPYCGLFTENTFYEKSHFELIDGVFIIRHLHQFHRMFRNEELMYDLNHAFEWSSQYAPTAFIQNPKGREVPKVFKEKFKAVFPEEMPFAEYRPTDLIDWRTGVAITGLNAVPDKYHKEIVEILINSTDNLLDRVLPESANFGALNLRNFILKNTDENNYVDYDKAISEIAKAIKVAKDLQESIEKQEKLNQEKEAEELYQVQLNTLQRALGVQSIKLIDSTFKNENLENEGGNLTKIGRNDRCSCGSGLKYKKCCLKM